MNRERQGHRLLVLEGERVLVLGGDVKMREKRTHFSAVVVPEKMVSPLTCIASFN